MANTEQIIFQTKVCFIVSQGVLKTSESTLKLNLSEQYILKHLIKHHNTPVTKDDLLKVGWPDSIVTEASLFQVIRALRVKLNEKNKGDVIETLPRIGYQIQDFTREYIDLDAQKTNINKKFIISLSIITTILFSSYVWYMFPSQIKPTHFLIKHISINSNNITFISHNLKQQVDLIGKAKFILTSPIIKNKKLFFYKSDQFYSIAGCTINLNTKQCKPMSDFNYKIALNAWGNFTQLIIKNNKIFHTYNNVELQEIQEPLSIAYRLDITDTNIVLKMSNIYISPTEKNNTFDYSKIKFIMNKKTGRYQASSLSAESLIMIKKDSQFITTLKIMPKVFHWNYSNNNEFSNNDLYYNYIVAAQKQLQLILSEKSGLYWLHSGKNNPLTWLPTKYYS